MAEINLLSKESENALTDKNIEIMERTFELFAKMNISPFDHVPQETVLEWYKISFPTIKEWEKEGLSRFKVNRKVFYDRKELNRFMAKHKQ